MNNTSEKHSKWPEAKTLPSGLYIVATPIGNLRDITLRALDTLAAADTIVCEDTRVSGKLLKAYSIEGKMLSYNDHSDDKRREMILRKIRAGECVALISDAGCPLISDPGYKLVQACMKEGLMITSIPGASAVITGLQLSGLPSDQFCFMGFLPSKLKARQDFLMEWKAQGATLVAYETGPRLFDSLGDIYHVLGNRKVSVARELTKMFEEIQSGLVLDLIEYYKVKGAPKGEIVLVIEGASQKIWTEEELEQALSDALRTMKTKDAANNIAEISGMPRKIIYEMALNLSGKTKQ